MLGSAETMLFPTGLAELAAAQVVGTAAWPGPARLPLAQSRPAMLDQLIAKLGIAAKVGIASTTFETADEFGFTVTFQPESDHFSLRLDRLHLRFEALEAALEHLDAAVTGRLRIVVERIDGSPFHWTLERQITGDVWRPIAEERTVAWYRRGQCDTVLLRNVRIPVAAATYGNSLAQPDSAPSCQPQPLQRLEPSSS